MLVYYHTMFVYEFRFIKFASFVYSYRLKALYMMKTPYVIITYPALMPFILQFARMLDAIYEAVSKGFPTFISDHNVH